VRPLQVMGHILEKIEEVVEKMGEVIGRGLMEGWGKAVAIRCEWEWD
jgi:hypothetical protein